MISTGYLVAAIALSYVGSGRGSKGHKEIINTYNSVKPHGYKMSMSDPWCAASWTAWQIMSGNTQKEVPMSASCSMIIADAKKLGIWVENDGYKPRVGDAILYDWDDSGRGDNTGSPDHIGVVYDRDSKWIYVVEGNKGSNSAVGKRAIAINGKFIRGFVAPKYKSLAKISYKPTMPYTGKLPSDDVRYGTKGGNAKALQSFLNWIDNASLDVDGSSGKATVQAILTYQCTYGLDTDGCFGPACRKKANELIRKYKPAEKSKAEEINATAIKYAWPVGTKESVYKYPKGKPDPDFVKAWKKYFPKKKINCGCHQFVMLVLKACGYPTMDISSWGKILKYLRSNFTELDVNYKQSQLKAGDIRVHKNSEGGYHIWIIVKEGGKFYRAEANQTGNKRYAHITTSTKGNTKKHKKDWLFRAK